MFGFSIIRTIELERMRNLDKSFNGIINLRDETIKHLKDELNAKNAQLNEFRKKK